MNKNISNNGYTIKSVSKNGTKTFRGYEDSIDEAKAFAEDLYWISKTDIKYVYVVCNNTKDIVWLFPC